MEKGTVARIPATFSDLLKIFWLLASDSRIIAKIPNLAQINLPMKTWLLLAGICFLSLSLQAQDENDEKRIMEPIARLFEGMRLGDSALAHSAFAEKASLVTIGKDKMSAPVLRKDDLQKFLAAVGSPHQETWNEPIWDAKVQTDGQLAQVWVSYAFFLGKKFSHCGIDAFDLYKDPGGKWRIFHVADTRKTEGCNVPAEIMEKFK